MNRPLLLKHLLQKFKKPGTATDRFLLFIVGGGFLLLLGLLGWLLWFSFTNRSVVSFLPAQKTVAYVELEDFSLPARLKGQTLPEFLGIAPLLDQAFGRSSSQDWKTVFGHGRIGLALAASENAKNTLLFFARPASQGKALEWMRSLAASGETLTTTGDPDHLIYSYPKGQPFVFTFVGPFLFASPEVATLQLIQQVNQKQWPSLESDPQYQKTSASLPRQSWAKGYLNTEGLSFDALSSWGQTLSPLKALFGSFAFAVRKEYNGFHFNSFLSLQPQALASATPAETRPLLHAANSLPDLVGSKNLALYLGGSDIGTEWSDALQTLSRLNPSYGIILEGLLRAQVAKAFGEEISLADDIYPLLEGAYGVVIQSSEDGSPTVQLILEHNDRTFSEIKTKKLLTGFRGLAARFSPKLKVVPLPDGTQSRELVADPSRLQESDETYRDFPIQCIAIAESPYGLCATVTDRYVFLANKALPIKESLDLMFEPRFSLAQSQPFRQSLGGLSLVNDEISFVDLTNASKLLQPFPPAALATPFLNPFEAATWVKHLFADGVSNEGYLLLK